ncbi:MAG: 4-amino-4-deoxy-L-arabinose transferase [Nocardioidaceae bacterium]
MTHRVSTEAILAATFARAKTCGEHYLIAIDGPAGAGKTSLANHLAESAPMREPTILRLDDIYPGWDGLAQLPSLLEPLLRDLACGRPANYRRYDWHALAPSEIEQVKPTELLILEGVGAGSRQWQDLVTTLVYVTHPQALERAINRDGPENRKLLEQWHQDETRMFAVERTQDRADFVITNGLD